mgnify:FL=1
MNIKYDDEFGEGADSQSQHIAMDRPRDSSTHT